MTRVRLLSALSTALLGAGVVVGVAPAAYAADPAVTLAGSLQSELGCPADWTPSCEQSELTGSGPDTWTKRVTLPAGSYEFKVTVGGTWAENYGAGGVLDGDNIPLVLLGPATVDVTYSGATHRVAMAPTDLPKDTGGAADRAIGRNSSLRAPLTKEQFYFVMTDRFANGSTANDQGTLTGDKLATGYDPTDKGFFHGGDLKGVMQKLDYIQKLGTTAIWLTPSFVNRPVQGAGADVSAGYHGYWITDFTRIDPHVGTNAEMTQLISLAHARGMKVFFDIITNHTADVIDYAEKKYTYTPKQVAPYTDAAGTPFDDLDYVGSPDFPAMNVDSFPYTPVFKTPADATVKTPAWLNDPTLYHNRGDSTYAGESSTYGDFSGLDDLFTEKPGVVAGMTDIYKAWVDFGIDGFRIDTAKHVNTQFWQTFSPALLAEAKAVGNPDFFMFGEVYDADPKFQSIYSTEAKIQSTLDFGFQAAAVGAANGTAPASLATLFGGDDYYTDNDSNAYNLPTFLGNHDMGRVGMFVGGSLAKDRFAHALMYTLRGQPVVYYGDEQGFTGDGGDKDARQDMFASQVASYNDDVLVGGATNVSKNRYDPTSPMYKTIAALSKLRKAHPALADGAQIPRYASGAAGIFAVSRVDRYDGVEYLVVANNAATAQSATFATYSPKTAFKPLYGAGAARTTSTKAGRVTVTVPPMTVQVFKAVAPIPASPVAPATTVAAPLPGGDLVGRAEVGGTVAGNRFVQVSFAVRPVGTTPWQLLGSDDNAPYRVFHDVSGYAPGTMLEYRMITRDNAGRLSGASTYGTVAAAPAGDPDTVVAAGTFQSEAGCPGDWQPDCLDTELTDPDGDGTFTWSTTAIPAGSWEAKVAIGLSWDVNYGGGGVPNGANIPFAVQDGQTTTFSFDSTTKVLTVTSA